MFVASPMVIARALSEPPKTSTKMSIEKKLILIYEAEPMGPIICCRGGRASSATAGEPQRYGYYY
eukprot:11457210-Heterocapsa_arctica.AAC.1